MKAKEPDSFCFSIIVFFLVSSRLRLFELYKAGAGAQCQ
jgi:hypothetical protein